MRPLIFAAKSVAPPARSIRPRGSVVRGLAMPACLALSLILWPQHGSAKKTERPEFDVLKAEFGLFYPTASGGSPAFVPAKVVPLVRDQAYGWVIVLKTKAKTVRWREEFTLPGSPATWGAPEPFGTRSTSDDGRTTITEREVTPKGGRDLQLLGCRARRP